MGWRSTRGSGVRWGAGLGVGLVLLAVLDVMGARGAWAQAAGGAELTTVGDVELTTVDLAAERQAVTTVSTRWRYHAGNDAAWAQPGYDDSGWATLAPGKDWAEQGYQAEGEQVWFRFRLRVAPKTPALVLQMPSIRRNYEIFADGRLVADVGFAPGSGGLLTGAPRVFTLPMADAPEGRTMLIALRFSRPEHFAWTSPDVLPGPVLVGQAKALLPQFARAGAWRLLQNNGMSYTEAVLQLPIMAAALLLLRLTRQRFYFWYGVNMAIGALSLGTTLASSHFGWDFRTTLATDVLWDFVGGLTLALFLAGYLELRSLRLVWLAILAQGMAEAGPLLVPFHLSVVWADVIYFVFAGASDVVLGFLAYRAWRAGAREAGLFLIPFSLSAGMTIFGNFTYILLELHVPGMERWIPGQVVLLQTPFDVTLLDLANTLALFGFLTLLVLRFARTNREQQRLAAALQAAHGIQTGLVASEAAALVGLRSEVVYLAAEEVGGDFCQILPREDGSVLAVIGDVSGKGLQAAMVGTLAVGALRSLAHEGVSPAAVLSRVNEVMLRSDQQGFVTCLCLEISVEGAMTVANAGHLPPYVNGVEVVCEPGLPLGLLAGLEYAETRVMLPEQARLTLLSDGVVEARSRKGELFGFARTSAISGRPAGEIAAAAREFGQQDDITVVTLDWTAAMVAV